MCVTLLQVDDTNKARRFPVGPGKWKQTSEVGHGTLMERSEMSRRTGSENKTNPLKRHPRDVTGDFLNFYRWASSCLNVWIFQGLIKNGDLFVFPGNNN